MYTYIVVDDERIIRQGIIKKISNITSLELDCVGEASNGEEGLQLVEVKNPDIIISDMKMHKMDGVTFLMELGQKYPDKHVIVISSFNNFEYMSTAIENRVVGYVLKPFQTEEIERIILKAAQQIEHQKQINKMADYLGTQAQSSSLRFLSDVILYSWDSSKEEDLNLHGYDPASKCILISVCSADTNLFMSAKQQIAHLAFCRSALVSHSQNKNQFFVLLCCDEGYSVRMAVLARTIAESLVDSQKLFVAVSDLGNGFMELHKLYKQNLTMLGQIHISDTNRIFVGAESISNTHMIYSEEEIKELFLKLRYSTEKPADLLKSFFSRVNISEHTLRSISKICRSLVEKVNDFASQAGVETEDVTAEFQNRYMLEDSLDRIRKEISGYITLVLHSVVIAQEKQTDLIESLKEYMNQFYDSKITLQSAADKFYLSPTYCGVFFKEKVGQSFNEYLTNIRMTKSKELLANTNISINRLAYEVGYSNPKYFFKIFKKETGYTPVNYRNIYKGA